MKKKPVKNVIITLRDSKAKRSRLRRNEQKPDLSDVFTCNSVLRARASGGSCLRENTNDCKSNTQMSYFSCSTFRQLITKSWAQITQDIAYETWSM